MKKGERSPMPPDHSLLAMTKDERLSAIEHKLDFIIDILADLCESLQEEEQDDGERDQTQPL